WFLLELLKPILPSGDQVRLNPERFNQLMLAFGSQLASERFYEYFFSDIATITDFESSVERFRVKAMWLFGNFKFAYKRLASVNLGGKRFEALINRTEPSDP